MTKILAYRFSAFGDIAMLVPVLKEFLDENPDTEILMVSRKNFKDLFDGIPRLKFKGVDLKEYEGFFELKKLSNEILSGVFRGDLQRFYDGKQDENPSEMA